MRRPCVFWFFVASLAACTSNNKAGDVAKTAVPIGSAGGTVTLAGVRATIPPGALTNTVTITMETPAVAPAGAVGSAVELGPAGTTFVQPVALVFPYVPGALPEADHPENLRLALATDGAWVPLTDSAVDTTAGTVTATTTHFSTYGVIQLCGPARACPADHSCHGYRCVPHEQCSGGVDDDGDGLVDCQDPDCAGAADCRCETHGELQCCYPKCSDDQVLQCLGDNICGYPCLCEAVHAEVCDNGVDDDGDGAVDCHDPDCQDSALCECGAVCCYPVCHDDEVLQCLGANICGYPCHCEAKVTEACANGADDDGDGLVDCRDPDCADSALCVCEGACCYPACDDGQVLICLGDNICGYPCHCETAQAEACGNGLDDDGDGLSDCQDPDCQDGVHCKCDDSAGITCCYPVCADDAVLECLGDNICGYPCHCRPPTKPEDCTNGVDDDGDGAVDCQDPDCHANAHCDCHSEGTLTCCYPQCGEHETLQCLGDNICGYPCSCVPDTGELCGNGADDDGDGLVDCLDPDCFDDAHCGCTPNQGFPCCYPTCAPGQVLECLGANICGYPCSCVPAACGECVSSEQCGEGELCTAAHDCLSSCDCPECDVCAGHCVSGKPQWYYTCGDPVCSGHHDDGTPACTTETVGEACDHLGTTCDPDDFCNRRVVCATSDPASGPGGCPISRRSAKHDIDYLDANDAARLLDAVLSMKLATWRYNGDPSQRQRLGFIIEDAPRSPAVDPQRDMVDLYGYTSLAIGALQVQARQIEALQQQVQALQELCGGQPAP